MNSNTPSESAALHQHLSEAGVHYALASYVDIHGTSKGKFVPLDHLQQMLNGSELFTGAALDGVPQDVSDDEVAAVPDPASATPCPWNPRIAWFASNLHLNGEPFEACSRNTLRRQVDAAAAMGYRMNMGVETEFFVFRDTGDGGFAPASQRDDLAKPCYDTTSIMDTFPLLTELVESMNGLGWDVYSFDHEDANGQFEIDFQYTDALTMADRFVFFRMMAKELAHQHGYFASFMPKPFADRTGSGAHLNMSLADANTGEKLFVSDADPHGCGLSQLGYQFIAGILRHGRALSAVVAPTVNSYKRLVKQGSMSGATWAPVFVCHGTNNRTNMIRIPGAGNRVECRSADISCNPYLSAAFMLAAGLEGIREGIDPGAPHTENMYHYSDDEVASMGIRELPGNLNEAIEAFAADGLAREVFGEELFHTFIAFKRAEWESYHNHVSDWERDRYLKFF